jgi:hypothetical protein
MGYRLVWQSQLMFSVRANQIERGTPIRRRRRSSSSSSIERLPTSGSPYETLLKHALANDKIPCQRLLYVVHVIIRNSGR